MIRVSVGQGQNTLQSKFSVQQEPNVSEVCQSHALDSVGAHADKHELKEQDDFGGDDDDDWDAFQSFPADNTAVPASDLHANVTETNPISGFESSSAITDDHYVENDHQYLTNHMVSEETGAADKLESSTDEERMSFDKHELLETLHSEHSVVETNESEENSNPPKERTSQDKDELEETLDSPFTDVETESEESSNPQHSADKERMSPDKDEHEKTLDSQHSEVEEDEDEPRESLNFHDFMADETLEGEGGNRTQQLLPSSPKKSESNGQDFEGDGELRIDCCSEERFQKLSADSPAAPMDSPDEISSEHSETVEREAT